MKTVVVYRHAETGEERRSPAFGGPDPHGAAHRYAILKTPPPGFVFHAVVTL